MSSRPELRPHFDLVVRLSPDDVISQLKTRFEQARPEWVGHLAGQHGQLVVPRAQRHLWSPWLTFTATEHEDGTLISGRFAPHPSVWTMYMAFYGMVGFSLFGFAMFGASQWMAGESPWMLWSIPICIALLAILYASAFVGQGLTADQMNAMRRFVKETFDDDQAQWVS